MKNLIPTGGDRYNEGKSMMSLLPPLALVEVAKVLTYGAKKYSRNNWMKGLPWTSYIDSLERHLQAWKTGEELDESGLLHIAHVGCNILMLIETVLLRPDLDDRPKEFYSKSSE